MFGIQMVTVFCLSNTRLIECLDLYHISVSTTNYQILNDSQMMVSTYSDLSETLNKSSAPRAKERASS